MIVDIHSSLPTFKTIRFGKGLNILVAERHGTSGARDTRNGTGKTSLIELLHFVIGDRKALKEADVYKPELVGNIFGATFLDAKKGFIIDRRANPGKASDEWFLDRHTVSPTELRAKLLRDWFSLDPETTAENYTPKFGALMAYFVRKERNGGFASATLNASAQSSWDSQVNLSFLLGFDWKIAQALQVAKDEKKNADNLVALIRGGLLSKINLDSSAMQARLDVLEVEVDRKRSEVLNARVLDGYESHESTANDIAGKIRDLNEANLMDLELLSNVDLALNETQDAKSGDVARLYQEVGIFFSTEVVKRLDQVILFHKALSRNRELQLNSERKRATQRIIDRREAINTLQVVLAEKLTLLRSSIAIERLSFLQVELNQLEAEMSSLQQQIPRIKGANQEQARLKRKIEELVELIGLDVEQRSETRKLAVNYFAESSKHLYSQPGNLIIGRSVGVSGLAIDTEIIAKKSGGKNHMQVFCFDWMLTQSALRLGRFPGFLFHDSHIFDGVDGRQIGLALSFAKKKCEELGVQYIVTMNSDDLEKVKNEEEASGELIFDPTPHILSTKLSDQEGGGLFGIRF